MLRLFSLSITRTMHHRAYDSRIYCILVYGPISWCCHKVDRLLSIYGSTFFWVAILCLEFVGDQSMNLFFNNQLQSGCVGFNDFSLVLYIYIYIYKCYWGRVLSNVIVIILSSFEFFWYGLFSNSESPPQTGYVTKLGLLLLNSISIWARSSRICMKFNR